MSARSLVTVPRRHQVAVKSRPNVSINVRFAVAVAIAAINTTRLSRRSPHSLLHFLHSSGRGVCGFQWQQQ